MSRLSEYFHRPANPFHEEGQPVFFRNGDLVIAAVIAAAVSAYAAPKIWPDVERLYNRAGITSMMDGEADAVKSSVRTPTP